MTDTAPGAQTGGTLSVSAPIDRKFIIQWFSPRWFIFIMGTGALANALQLVSSGGRPFFHSLAVFFVGLSLAAFPIVAALKLVRLCSAYHTIAHEWSHSSLIQFYSAIPIAAAVNAAGLLNVPIPGVHPSLALALATGFWAISVALSLVFIVAIPFRVIVGSHAEPKRALGFWFLPPVGLFVTVFSGNFLAMKTQSAGFAESILFFNLFVLGIAVFLTAAVFTIFLFRAFFYSFPRPDVTPSYMIGIAPIGVALIAINTLLPVLRKVAVESLPSVPQLVPLVNLFSLLLWGFGFWWLLVALLIIGRSALKSGIPVTLGYWAFIFPAAAYTIATLIVAKNMHLPTLWRVGEVFAVLVTAGWAFVFAAVLRHTFTRKIFELPPSFSEIVAGQGSELDAQP
jgi:tellurite resistance protein TehA-like permease